MSKVHFTKSFIDSIEPVAGRNLTFTDEKVRGLTLIVTPAPYGTKTFYFRRKHRGRVSSIKLGRFPECSVQIAREQSARYHNAYDAGDDPARAKQREREELTLTAFFEIYYRDHSLLQNKQPKYARYTFEHYIAPALGRLRLSEVTRDAIAHLHRSYGQNGRQRTANKAHSLLRAILNKARAWEYLTGDNPAQFIQRFREHSRDRFLTTTELPRFHDALAEEPEVVRDLLLILLFTGARKSEALTMQWRHVDLDEGVWRIPEPKNQEPHRVALSGAALAILRRRAAADGSGSPWVFPGKSAEHHFVDPKRAWERICTHAGLENFRIHDLRRTLGTWLRAGGADLITIQKALGHKDYKSTLIYARLDLDTVRIAIEKTSRELVGKPHLAYEESAK